jgi:hypothetical protein
MKEINEIITTKTQAMIVDGTLEGMIEKQLEESIQNAVSNAFRSYSDFGKAISEKIEESIAASRNDIKIPQYNTFIAKVVKDRFVEVLEDQALENISSLIESDLSPIVGEQTSQDVMNSISKYWGDTAREHGKEEIEIEIEYSDSSEAIYAVIKHPEYDWYDIKVTFYKFRDDKAYHVGYISQNDKRMTHGIDGITHAGDLCRYFFKLYAMRTEIDFSNDELCSIDVCNY